MTYTELYPKLVQLGFLVLIDIPPMQPPYLRWYNENAQYDYHSGNRGHSIEDCTALKRRVHDLMKAGALAFDDEDIPDVNRNPLTDHQRPKVNAVESDLELLVEKDATAIRMSMKTVYEALLKAEMLEEEQEKKKGKRRPRKGTLSISQRVCGSLHPSLSRFPRASAGNDE